MANVRDVSTATVRNRLSEVERSDFLREANLTRFSTIRPDGWAHTTPVYYTWEDEVILHSIGPNRQHLRNLENSRQVTECMDVDYRLGGDVEAGAVSVVCYGIAEIVDEAAIVADMTKRMLARYMGPEAGQLYFEKVAHEVGNGRVLVRVRPERWITWDYRKAIGQ